MAHELKRVVRCSAGQLRSCAPCAVALGGGWTGISLTSSGASRDGCRRVMRLLVGWTLQKPLAKAALCSLHLPCHGVPCPEHGLHLGSSSPGSTRMVGAQPGEPAPICRAALTRLFLPSPSSLPSCPDPLASTGYGLCLLTMCKSQSLLWAVFTLLSCKPFLQDLAYPSWLLQQHLFPLSQVSGWMIARGSASAAVLTVRPCGFGSCRDGKGAADSFSLCQCVLGFKTSSLPEQAANSAVLFCCSGFSHVLRAEPTLLLWLLH